MKAKTSLIDKVFWSAYNRYWDNSDQAVVVQQRVEDAIGKLAQNGAQPPQRILDAGCGTGVYTLALAQAGFKATGVDSSPDVLAKANRKATELKLDATFEKMNLDHFLWYSDNYFDHALCASVLHWSGKPASLLQELNRVIKPSGLLVVTLWLDPKKHREAYPQVFSELEPKRNLRERMLGRVKSMGENSHYAHYWSVEEFQKMLTSASFEVLSMDGSPLVTAVARRS